MKHKKYVKLMLRNSVYLAQHWTMQSFKKFSLFTFQGIFWPFSCFQSVSSHLVLVPQKRNTAQARKKYILWLKNVRQLRWTTRQVSIKFIVMLRKNLDISIAITGIVNSFISLQQVVSLQDLILFSFDVKKGFRALHDT